MTATVDSTDQRGGTRHLLLKVARRGLLLAAVCSWAAWVIGGFGILVIDPPPLRTLGVTVRSDEQGVMFQWSPKWRRPQAPYIQFHEPNPVPWRHSLSDQESTWITSWLVFSSWTASGAPYQLVGVRHVALLFVSVVIFAALFRRAATRKPDVAAMPDSAGTDGGQAAV